VGGIRRFIALACIILLASIAPVSAITYQLNYDANGNLVDDGRFAYEYDDINQLIKVSNAQGVLEEYAYDESGSRIIKIIHNPDGTKTAVYTPFKEFSREIGTETKDTVFYYDDQALVARKDASGTYFYHPDHLGSTDIVTDEQGNVVEQYEYLPFGAQLSGADSRFTFTGQEKDDTGLMYYKSRYYEPVIGRFIQPDTMLPDIYDPQQLNRYAYARNNPVKYTDPEGHYVESAFDIAFIGSDLYYLYNDVGDWTNWAALGGDIVGLLLPGLTGVGLLIRGGKAVSKVDDVAKVVKAGEIRLDANKVAKVVKLSKEAKLLQKGKDGTTITVNSFQDGEKLLHEAFPNYKKVTGNSPNAKSKERFEELRKRYNDGGTYKMDYQYGPNGRVHGTGNHADMPHINIKRRDGSKVTININTKGRR